MLTFALPALVAAIAAATMAGCSDMKPREDTREERAQQGFVRTNEVDERFSITKDVPRENLDIDLPATSLPDEWLSFKVRNLGVHRFAIAPNSVTQGSDGIVRYTLLVRTAGGVDNVTHEGMRCATKTWKLYAIGRDNGEWSRLPDPVWRPITLASLNAARFSLSKDYICVGDGVRSYDAKTIAARIRASNEGRLYIMVR